MVARNYFKFANVNTVPCMFTATLSLSLSLSLGQRVDENHKKNTSTN